MIEARAQNDARQAETSGMRNGKAGAGLWVAMLGVVGIGLSVAGAEVPETNPEPRPLEIAAVVTAAAQGDATAQPSVEAPPVPSTAHAGRVGPVTGFPIPRYVSMKASEANARRGPSRSHRIDWVFQRRGMPMMVVAEHGHWRRVVDRDGVGGWMHYSLLSGVRTAIVETDMLPLHSRPDATSPVRARAELGVIGRLSECRPDWCLMETGGYRGWVDPRALWGVEPGEVFD